MGDNHHCVNCERSMERRQHHTLSADFLVTRREFVEFLLNNIDQPQEIAFDGSRAICHPCWQRIDYAIRAPRRARPEQAQIIPEYQSIAVTGLTRTPNSARRCMFDNCNNLELRTVPNTLKTYLLSYYELYISSLSRICRHHLSNTTWEDFATYVTRRQTDFCAEHVREIVQIYTKALEQKVTLDFESLSEIDEDTLHFWTGVSQTQFIDILEQTPSLLERSKTPNTDLAVYLCKIRTGEPGVRLASIFNMTRQTLERKIKMTRECLTNDYVPLHLGFDHITRNDVILGNKIIPNHIFGTTDRTKAIIICDGTYLHIQKSSNFLFQRLSYSIHKFTNLIKPFMIVSANGYIIDVTGPYAATTSDATIMKLILDNHNGELEEAPIRWFLEEGDVFVLDRGFRDAVSYSEECGYVAHIPPSKQRNESQLSTESANKSRLLTMVRWVVETINGRFKRDFKIFRNTFFNKSASNAICDFKIAASLINAYQEPYADSPYSDAFVEIINRNMHKPNLLADYVDDQNMNQQRVAFMRLEATHPDLRDFPRLTYEELVLFAVGTYHLKLARSYCWEHIRGDGVFNIEVYRYPESIAVVGLEDKILLRGRISSRHVRARTYYTYILYNPTSNGRSAIAEHLCSCIHGRRTLGSCAHVISMLYYLAYARHEENMQQPASFLDSILIDYDSM